MQNLLERPPVSILPEPLGIIRFLGPEHLQLAGGCVPRLGVTRPTCGPLSICLGDGQASVGGAG